MIEIALDEARDAHNSGKYEKSIELANNANKMAKNAQETLSEHIEPAQAKIDETKSLGADVKEAENRLKKANDALNKGNYKYAKVWANDASELAKHTSVGSVKISDLLVFPNRYDKYTVTIKGVIKEIETVSNGKYTFSLDDNSSMISVVYQRTFGRSFVNEGDNVTVIGIFQASNRTVFTNNLKKSKGFVVPGFKAIFTLISLLAVAYLITRKKN